MLTLHPQSVRQCLAIAALTLALVGCNSAQTGALLGSAIGAAAGAGIDHNNRGRGALIGAGVGAVGGYIVGNEIDKSRQYPQYNSGGGYQGYNGGYSGGYAQPTYVEAHYYEAPAPRVYYHETRHHHYPRHYHPRCDW